MGKPRKKYRPKPVVLPLGMRNNAAFEIPGYQASIALGQLHFCESHLYDLLANADMVRRIATPDNPIYRVSIGMIEAVACIQARQQRKGVLGCNGDELKVLREGVAQTMEYLRGVSNIAIDRAARDALKEFDKYGGIGYQIE